MTLQRHTIFANFPIFSWELALLPEAVAEVTMSQIYEQCSISASQNGGTPDTFDLLACISQAHEQARTEAGTDVAKGIDAFYLLFAGALVYFMQVSSIGTGST